MLITRIGPLVVTGQGLAGPWSHGPGLGVEIKVEIKAGVRSSGVRARLGRGLRPRLGIKSSSSGLDEPSQHGQILQPYSYSQVSASPYRGVPKGCVQVTVRALVGLRAGYG